jgi:hypothetical protein
MLNAKVIKTMRPLNMIAREIKKEWKNPYFGAVPYLRAMGYLNSVTDSYGLDSADMIVRYFLATASTFRGESARRIKKELNRYVKKLND